MLGKYLTLSLMLPSGALAGFLLGRLAEHWIHASWPTLLGIILGVVASVAKVFGELNRDLRREERERLQSSQPGPTGSGDIS
jgi:F0F1-type ATP synthase assembly protein I